MKKRFIELATSWKYTWTAWVVIIIGILSTVRFGGTMYTLRYYSPVIIASILLSAGYWQGCFFGILNAFFPVIEYLYNCWLIKYKGMVIYHNWNPWLFTALLITYYTYIGLTCYKENRK